MRNKAYYGSISGADIGKNTRNPYFLKTNSVQNPGPGNYGPTKADLTASPKFG